MDDRVPRPRRHEFPRRCSARQGLQAALLAEEKGQRADVRVLLVPDAFARGIAR